MSRWVMPAPGWNMKFSEKIRNRSERHYLIIDQGNVGMFISLMNEVGSCFEREVISLSMPGAEVRTIAMADAEIYAKFDMYYVWRFNATGSVPMKS